MGFIHSDGLIERVGYFLVAQSPSQSFDDPFKGFHISCMVQQFLPITVSLQLKELGFMSIFQSFGPIEHNFNLIP